MKERWATTKLTKGTKDSSVCRAGASGARERIGHTQKEGQKEILRALRALRALRDFP
jgi:hypothetical protein